jgi:hypothetical protein
LGFDHDARQKRRRIDQRPMLRLIHAITPPQ